MCAFVCIYVYVIMIVSHVQLFATPWTVAPQAPLSLAFSRQEHWMGKHSLLLGNSPIQGSKPVFLHCRQILYHLSTKEAHLYIYMYVCMYVCTFTLWKVHVHRTTSVLHSSSEKVVLLSHIRLPVFLLCSTAYKIYNVRKLFCISLFHFLHIDNEENNSVFLNIS